MSAYLDAAVRAGRHLLEVERDGVWPVDPDKPEETNPKLYSGTAGVVLFLIELAHATGDRSFLDAAHRGGERLRREVASVRNHGLYEGVAGVGLTLLELGDSDGASACIRELERRSEPAGDGVEWTMMLPPTWGPPDAKPERSSSTDIITGLAGIVLFLLRAGATDLALAAGRTLIARGDTRDGGLDWALDPNFGYRMPNFSHGTAGVAYALATLAMHTGDDVFLDAALRGGRYLRSIARTDGGVCLIQRNDPPDVRPGDDGTIRYPLAWCHGPPGTGHTWYRLWEATGDRGWLDWLERSATALLPDAIPPDLRDVVIWREEPNYCHGLPSNGDFLLGCSRVLGRDDIADAGFAMFDRLLEMEGPDGRWFQDHPDGGRVALTSFAIGAAGVGFAMLHADGFITGRPQKVRMPDLVLMGRAEP